MQKRVPQGIIAQTFTHATPANMAAGDMVCITGDMTVDSTVNGRAIGQIITINKATGQCVVELFGNKIVELASAGALAAGVQVKLSAKNTVVIATPVTVAADIPLAFGTTLNNLAGAGTSFVVCGGRS